MERKKWTPKVEITEEVLKFREKRKWQLALRRYVLEKNPSPTYAIYFGLSIEGFRNWIEIQFTDALNWENFGLAWQFNHVVPVAYFDFSIEEDLLLCWNFINIRVEKIEMIKTPGNGIDIIAANSYFNRLYSRTNYYLCLKMTEKINSIEAANMVDESVIESFIIQHRDQLDVITTLNMEEFNRLNTGMSLNDILMEREIIKKFG